MKPLEKIKALNEVLNITTKPDNEELTLTLYYCVPKRKLPCEKLKKWADSIPFDGKIKVVNPVEGTNNKWDCNGQTIII